MATTEYPSDRWEYPTDLWQKAYMRQLADQIAEWKQSYYYGIPAVTDSHFDLWWRNLVFLEEKYPHLKDPNSPTINPGAPLRDGPISQEVRRVSLSQMKDSLALR